MVKPILGILKLVFPVIKTRLDSFISCRPEPGPLVVNMTMPIIENLIKRVTKLDIRLPTQFFKLQLVACTL